MKKFIWIGILLLAGGVVINSNIPASGSWLTQTGVIILLSTLNIYATKNLRSSQNVIVWKIVQILSLLSVVFLLSIGFYTRIWFMHPLGFVLSLIGSVWILFSARKI